jgi:hypothetical protein
VPRLVVELADHVYDRALREAARDGLSVEAWAGAALEAILTMAVSPEAEGARSADEGASDDTIVIQFHRQAPTGGDLARSRLARVAPELIVQARATPLLLELLLFPYQPGEAGSGDDWPVAAEIVDLAGAWDGLHYVLSPRRRAGDVEALAAEDPFGLALYGLPLAADLPALGYRPPGYVPPAVVGALATGLASLRQDDLRAVYEPLAMDAQHVYPLAWARDRKEGLEYLLYYFELLRDFYLRAALAGQAVVCCLW